MARKGLTYRVEGIKEIQRAYRELPGRVAKKVVRQAVRAGIKVVAAEARALAPDASGFLKSRIKVRASLKRRRGMVAFEIRIGDKDFTGKSYYGAMVEFGTKKQEGQHFLERALENKKAEASSLMISMIRDGIEREARG